MSFERYISDFGSFGSALQDYGVENLPTNILFMDDQDIQGPDSIIRIFEQEIHIINGKSRIIWLL